MPTHKITATWQDATGDSVSATKQLTADAEDNRTLSIPDSTTDQEVFISIDQSAIKILYFYSDKAVTIETNNSSAPDDTISLAAGIPRLWISGSGDTCPITVDVTKIYVTNASGATATVEIRVLQDSTP